MRTSRAKIIAMVGPAIDAPGGMSAVAETYRASGMFERCGIRYIPTYVAPGLVTQVRTMGRALLELTPLLVLGRVLLVHAHCASRGSFWRKAVICCLARCLSVPYLIHIHSGEFPVFYGQECGPVRQRVVRWVLRGAACVIVLTPSWLRAFNAIEPAARLRAIPNPIKVGIGQAMSSGGRGRNVLFLGRLREKKGVFDLIAALPEVAAMVPDVRFVLAGDGDQEAIRKITDALGRTEHVTMPGWVSGKDKAALLAEADVFVLPSYFEGLPIGVLEAMEKGVPVVATRVGGIPDVITDGQTGLLVEAGDVEGLARAISRCLTDPALATHVRKNARHLVETEFQVDKVVAQLESMYTESMQSGKAKAYD